MNKRDIIRSLKYKLIGSKHMKRRVVEVLQLLPTKISKFVSKCCWFVSSFEDGYAFVIRGDEIKKGEYLIFLSDELLKESHWQIKYTIIHEIAHVVLAHRNSIGQVQLKKEINEQEREADEFVKKYLVI